MESKVDIFIINMNPRVLVEMGQRLEGFKQEVHFIEVNKIEYLAWQSIDVPTDTVSPFLVIRPKQEQIVGIMGSDPHSAKV